MSFDNYKGTSVTAVTGPTTCTGKLYSCVCMRLGLNPTKPCQTPIHEIARVMKERGIGETVRYRALRLNPGHREGDVLRGWHPAPTLHSMRFVQDVVGKREFISRFGRDAWGQLLKSSIVKNGRRAYVKRYAVEDHLWFSNQKATKW